MDPEAIALQLKLFEKSVAKQAKWRALNRLLAPASVRNGLDLGSDNGVISYLLRARGGCWHSADIDEAAVAAIRSMVGERVCRIDPPRLPFPDAAFDTVVVLDLLEHVHDDHGLARELARVLEPGGRLIVNVPHVKPLATLRPLRLALGLTDAWHGHVRPGYTLPQLRALLEPWFVIRRHITYGRFFSELLDILLNFAYRRTQRSGPAAGTQKGTIVTARDLAALHRSFRTYARVYPLLRAWAALDGLVWPTRGYYLALLATRRPDAPPSDPPAAPGSAASGACDRRTARAASSPS